MLSGMGIEGQMAVDSVFLLSKTNWEELCKYTKKPSEKYVLVYDFEDSDLIEYLAKLYAKQKGVKVYSIGARRLKYADKCFTKSGPIQFLSLVKNAECVIGNSFHGILFSIIFERDFFVVRRNDGLNARMEDLLKRYDLSHRMIVSHLDDNALLEHVDFNHVNDKLASNIDSTKQFLAEQIKLAE